MCFVNNTSAFLFRFALVFSVASDGAFEKAGTAVASEDVVVFAGGVVAAHFTRDVEDSTCKWKISLVFRSEGNR